MTGGRPPSGGARDDMAEPADPGLPDPALEALRDRAERLAGPSDAPIPEGSVTLSAEAVRQTLHELQVHQIELEMQNQELRRAQEELEASRTRYFDLFDLAPVGYLTLTEHGLIREANLASASLFGTSKSALLQQPLTRFIASEDQDIYYGARKRLVETGAPQVFELRMLRKNAAPFWAQVESVLAGEDPMAPVTRVVISDVTVLKQAEETLRLAQKLEAEANLIQIQRMESVGRLAGGVAHDFNNLLVVINGYCHLLLKELAATNPQRETIKEILAAGERATELTRQLLAYSRKQILHPQSFDLNQVVTGLQPMLARLVGEDVEVQLSLDTGISEVFADPHQMEQIVMNLVVNARDAMPDGGQITIRTAEVEWNESAARLHPGAGAGCYVMLAVSDTGVGMNEETRRHIFEPFFTTKEIGRGTGLGLSTVQGIVSQSGGCVEVQSQPGRGATFRVYLPGIPAQPAEVAPLPEVLADTAGNETVLVVEDQAQVRNYAANVLATYGYNAITAENGADALRQSELEAGRIDLLLTDVVMPHMRGRELASQLRRLRPGIKVLFMSGYDDPAEGTLGTREAGTGFIQKPFTPDDLAARIHDLLGPR